MGTCLYCGKSGIFLKLTKNKLCRNCDTFVVQDIQNRGRIINESLESVNNSNNINTVLSRCDVIIEQLTDLMNIYEDKGIRTTKPEPSVFLQEFLNDRDKTIVEGCERELEKNIVSAAKLKTKRGKINRFRKLSEKIDHVGNELDDPSLLDPIKNKIEYRIADRAEIKDKEELPTGVDWNLVNQEAVDWARNYSYEELLPGITNVEREAVQKHVAAFFEEGLTIGQLMSRLEEVLDPEMAELIASTETTRAAVESELAQAQELSKTGVIMIPVWQTCNDSLVCDICKSFHDKRADIYELGKRPKWIYKKTGKEYSPPPCHEGCRCWINHEPDYLRP